MRFAAVLLVLSVLVPTALAASTSREPAYRPNAHGVTVARKTVLGRAFIGQSPRPNKTWVVGVPTCNSFAPDQSALTVIGKAAGFYADGAFGMGSEVDVYDSPIGEQAAWRLLVTPAYAFCAAQKVVAWYRAHANKAKLVGVYHFRPRGGPRQEVGYQIAVRITNTRGSTTVYHSIVWMSLEDTIARVESAAPTNCTCADEGVAALYRNFYS